MNDLLMLLEERLFISLFRTVRAVTSIEEYKRILFFTTKHLGFHINPHIRSS